MGIRSVTTRDLPSGPEVKNPPFNAGDTGSIPGQGSKAPFAARQLSLNTTIRKPTYHKQGSHVPQLRPDTAK